MTGLIIIGFWSKPRKIKISWTSTENLFHLWNVLEMLGVPVKLLRIPWDITSALVGSFF